MTEWRIETPQFWGYIFSIFSVIFWFRSIGKGERNIYSLLRNVKISQQNSSASFAKTRFFFSFSKRLFSICTIWITVLLFKSLSRQFITICAKEYELLMLWCYDWKFLFFKDNLFMYYYSDLFIHELGSGSNPSDNICFFVLFFFY